MHLHLGPFWGLIFARLAGAMLLAPPFSWRHFPVLLRLSLSAVLAFPITLAVSPVQPLTLTVWAYILALVREAALGLFLGFALWLFLWAAFAAGHLQDLLGGWAISEDEGGPLAELFHVLAAVFFVQLNGLPWLMMLFVHSYRLVPVGRSVPLWGNLEWLTGPSLFFSALVQVALPMFFAIILASLILSSLQRTLSQLRAAEILPASRAIVTLLVVTLSAPYLGGLFWAQINHIAYWLAGILSSL